jgi:hypothetical protein
MLGCAVIVILILFAANLFNNRLDIALVTLGAGALWLAGQWRSLPGLNSVGFAAGVAMTGITVGLGGAPIAGLLALVIAIIAWDLGRFQQRLIYLQLKEAETDLFRLHMYRLMVVVALSLILPVLGLFVQVGITIVWAIVWGIIITISLSLTINLVRRYVNER